MQNPPVQIPENSDEKMLVPRFRKRIQGYDPAEVDALVDDWQKKIADLSEQNTQQAMALQDASRFVAEVKEKSVEDTRLLTLVMATAEKVSGQIVADANADAKKMKQSAQHELFNARNEAKEIIAKAESEAAERRARMDKEMEQARIKLRRDAEMVQRAIEQKLSDAHKTFAQLAALSVNVKDHMAMLDDVNSKALEMFSDIQSALPFDKSGSFSVFEMQREVVRVTNVQKVSK